MVIIGDGPGGYEGALVARQLGADVTLVSAGQIGGSAVLTDCVPSKTLIATSEAIDQAAASGYLGVRIDGRPAEALRGQPHSWNICFSTYTTMQVLRGCS